ncbi:homoserine dehydrogenase [Xanthobacter variabilis]|uniref:homoserine dehydrogenase n=1 Tax=Xanthobacter variabilis TaxID=3119932 RepID=UPI00372836BF
MSDLKVGLAGLGTVGAAVIRMLERRAGDLFARTGRGIKVVAVAARDRTKDRGVDLSGVRWYEDPVELARDPDIDVFVELMGGSDDPAKAAVIAALERGRPVVTANKALLAKWGADLARIAENSGASLHFEAAVAGGIPIVKTLRESLAGNVVERVSGILNGTCNYMLTRMADEKISFQDCLAEAQRLGYAEADPTFDIDGFDTAHKLAILTSLAFGTQVDADAIYVEGIRQLTLEDLEAADDLGYKVKLLGVALRTETGIEQRVHPTMVPKHWPIAQVSGVTNAVAVDADAVSLTLVGPGAGGDATASAVVGDLADVARGVAGFVFGMPVATLMKPERAPMQRHEGGYYIRLSVVNKPGTAATIARRMADEGISLESIVQRRPEGQQGEAAQGTARVILITYATSEEAVRRAIAAIEADGVVNALPQVIRIEKD